MTNSENSKKNLKLFLRKRRKKRKHTGNKEAPPVGRFHPKPCCFILSQ